MTRNPFLNQDIDDGELANMDDYEYEQLRRISYDEFLEKYKGVENNDD